jgi:hypothetical protein
MADFNYDETGLVAQESAARRARRNAFAQAGLERANLQQQTQRQLRDTSRAYRQAASPQITSFTGRGLGRSGLFNKAMQDFVSQRQQQLGDIQASAAAGEASIQLKEQQASQALQDELDRIAALRQAQILGDAMAIKEFAPMTGLFS